MKGGTIRRMAGLFGIIAGVFGRPVTHHYPDPKTRDPRDRKKKRGTGSGSRRFAVERIKRSVAPPCHPGTITYHDKLVRHFGRRQADKYGRCIIAKQLDLLPTAEDFAANPPWAFLTSQRPAIDSGSPLRASCDG
jgi:hypothetical protein